MEPLISISEAQRKHSLCARSESPTKFALTGVKTAGDKRSERERREVTETMNTSHYTIEKTTVICIGPLIRLTSSSSCRTRLHENQKSLGYRIGAVSCPRTHSTPVRLSHPSYSTLLASKPRNDGRTRMLHLPRSTGQDGGITPVLQPCLLLGLHSSLDGFPTKQSRGVVG